jgi:hypothetical protein
MIGSLIGSLSPLIVLLLTLMFWAFIVWAAFQAVYALHRIASTLQTIAETLERINAR